MKWYIAIVGQMGAGKETIYQQIKDLAQPLTVSIHHFSDPVNELLRKVGIENSRENQQKHSTSLRDVFGQTIFSDTIKKRVLADLADIVVLDGVRLPGDVEMLRSLLNNLLLYVTADSDKRYERIKKRNDRPGEATMTRKEFDLRQQAETEIRIKALGAQADFWIDNSGDLECLRGEVRKFLFEKVGLQ